MAVVHVRGMTLAGRSVLTHVGLGEAQGALCVETEVTGYGSRVRAWMWWEGAIVKLVGGA